MFFCWCMWIYIHVSSTAEWTSIRIINVWLRWVHVFLHLAWLRVSKATRDPWATLLTSATVFWQKFVKTVSWFRFFSKFNKQKIQAWSFTKTTLNVIDGCFVLLVWLKQSKYSFIDKVEIVKCLQTDELTGRVNEKSSGEVCIRWAKNYKVEISLQEMLIYF